ncbi:MAG: diaminopimelate decarboxylase [Burkholderiales bacterium]|nr:diaminopimelate decarboxylase [Burkholderiales bacterium]MDQ3195667.1 diaminopimelate decarboxylase [Pseudomonadota bacterium]
MEYFPRLGGRLHAESVALSEIAEQFGTPCYVYSRAALTDAYRSYDVAFDRRHLICYAVKANPNLAILNLLARLGSGFDVVSGGELQRVIAAGGDPGKTVFSGVGKSADEMRFALEAGILCFNVESKGELLRLDRIAGEAGRTARVSIRVNPDVDARTHPYIATGLKQNKFGVAYADALPLYRMAAASPNLHVTGIDCHIGSQLTEIAPFVAAFEKILALLDRLTSEKIRISHLDLGGGLGIRYRDELPPSIDEYARDVIATLGARDQSIVLEPGRSLVGNAGLLLTRVEYLKHGEDKNFAVVDAAMNDLLRPALYDAWHDIVPVEETAASRRRYDVVGPVCESADFFARERELELNEGELLAVLSAGAYGMSMSSNYNTRPRAAEVMIDGRKVHLIRERETFDQLIAGEKRLPS